MLKETPDKHLIQNFYLPTPKLVVAIMLPDGTISSTHPNRMTYGTTAVCSTETLNYLQCNMAWICCNY
jgi:hypothetical protein